MIRFATEAEAEAVAGLSRECFTEGISVHSVASSISEPQELVLVAEEEGRLLGYAILCFAADEGELLSIGVLPGVRRNGVGRKLMETLFYESATKGVRKIFLEVRETNAAAQRLYESLGFLHAGVRRNFYTNPKEDAYLLMRPMLWEEES